MQMRFACVAALAAVLAFGVGAPRPAAAASIGLSEMSSDQTPASVLKATLNFTIVGGGTQLQVDVFNDTMAPDEFNIDQVFWNGSADVSGLALVSATHSVAGDVFADWNPVESPAHAGGFGDFDFGLIGPVGQTQPALIGPSESITFVLDIVGACATAMDCDAVADFLSVANANGKGVAGKFVNGPGDDSAYGASAPIPEPGSLALGLLGLLGLAGYARRQRAR